MGYLLPLAGKQVLGWAGAAPSAVSDALISEAGSFFLPGHPCMGPSGILLALGSEESLLSPKVFAMSSLCTDLGSGARDSGRTTRVHCLGVISSPARLFLTERQHGATDHSQQTKPWNTNPGPPLVLPEPRHLSAILPTEFMPRSSLRQAPVPQHMMSYSHIAPSFLCLLVQ